MEKSVKCQGKGKRRKQRSKKSQQTVSCSEQASLVEPRLKSRGKRVGFYSEFPELLSFFLSILIGNKRPPYQIKLFYANVLKNN